MAFNPSPEVAAARDIAKRFKAKQVIVLMISDNGDDEHLQYASYGETKALCDDAKKIADAAFDAVMDYMVLR